MCQVLDVSRSGYYDWVDRPESEHRKRHRALRKRIEAIHKDNHEVYGSPRIHWMLVSQGEMIGENTVAQVMRRSGNERISVESFYILTEEFSTPPRIIKSYCKRME